jgi:carbamoyltransferase
LYDSNPFEDRSRSSLAVDPNTQLVIGLNKYSHDTALCAADAETGQVLLALSKERITRRKHDSGNVASLVETCLETLDLHLENIVTVVMNNHHHRILPMEENQRHVEWEAGLRINGGMEDGYDEPENLLRHAIRHELSHHLAHAYSTVSQAPFDSGLCVVADGMGETYRTLRKAADEKDTSYTGDFSFVNHDALECVPHDIAEKAANSYFDWREAESVYTFQKSAEHGIQITPIFKRFTPENSSPTLYNHGFENMDSVGALYSRASSHIFGDWNACGKVMGLAPWAKYSWTVDNVNSTPLTPKLHKTPIMSGKLWTEDFHIDRSLLEGQPHIARSDPDLFEDNGVQKKRYDFDDNNSMTDDETTSDKRLPVAVALDAIALADRIQNDLETVMMDFVRHFKEKTKSTNLCLAGGVALNSVLNGRLARELGFQQTFVPPYPGDDGIAIGCCAFGLFGKAFPNANKLKYTLLWKEPLSPYLGPNPSELDIKEAIRDAEPWLQIDIVRDDNQRLEMMAQQVATGAVVAWYRSRSEMGPRALGHRSILADPRKKGLVRFINEHVKSRESFRPFAPSVLAEEASQWFDLGTNAPKDSNVSPFMSMTAMAHEEKRALIPAVTHVDGSSRLQTVTRKSDSLYHAFISKFWKLTGVPMVLNTSFNTLPSEPIVETPRDAIRSFLYSMGAIEMLVLGDYVIKRKQADLKTLLGEVTKDGDMKVEPICPKRSGFAKFEASFDLDSGETDEETIQTKTKVCMPDRPMHGIKNEWFELLDDLEVEILTVCDGTQTLNDIMAQYSSLPDEAEEISREDAEEAQVLLQNIVHRLVRLFEHTLIRW